MTRSPRLHGLRRRHDRMIKVSILYPGGAVSTFNMDYYLNRHIPMVRAKLGTACKNAAVEQGLGGATPGSPPAFSAMGHLYFDSVEAFQTAFGHTLARSWTTYLITPTSNRRFR